MITKNREITRFYQILRILFVICVIPVIPFHAYAFADSLPSASIDIRYHLNGDNSNTDEPVVFILSAEDEDTPMPDGAKGGIRTLSMDHSGRQNFGTITYDKPDVYRYTVSRKYSSQDGKLDQSVYDVSVTVLANGSTDLVIEKKGITGKLAEIEYTDRIGRKKLPAPDTGDQTEIIHWILRFLIAMLALILLILVRRESSNNGMKGGEFPWEKV